MLYKVEQTDELRTQNKRIDNSHEDVRLSELLQTFLKNKVLIISATLVFIFVITILALYSPPSFTTEIVLEPSYKSDFSDLVKICGCSLSPNENFKKLIMNLISAEKREVLFANINRYREINSVKLKHSDHLLADFNQKLFVFPDLDPDGKSMKSATVELWGRDPNLITEILNDLVREAFVLTSEQLAEHANLLISGREKAIKNDIKFIQRNVELKLLDELSFQIYSNKVKKRDIENKLMAIRADVVKKKVDQNEKLNGASENKLQGFKTAKLQDQLDQVELVIGDLLLKRKNIRNTFFHNLKQKRLELKMLEDTFIDSDAILPGHIKGIAHVPTHPIKPVKTLMIIISVLTAPLLIFLLTFFVYLYDAPLRSLDTPGAMR